MQRFVWIAFVLVLFALCGNAQTATPNVPAPVRVCVANFKNELRQQVDTLALRDRLAAYWKRGPLAKDSRVEIITLNGDSDASAAPELKEQKCDFAIFSRVVLGRVEKPDPQRGNPMPGYSSQIEKEPPPPAIVTGVQFTAVRVSTGIPILIDRVFLDRQAAKEEDLWQLLVTEQERTEAVLQKKLAAQKPA